MGDPFDTDGDGLADAIRFDADGDGFEESAALDTNRNGLYDTILVDRAGTGFADVVAVDDNEDGVLDRALVDQDGDRVLETAVSLNTGVPDANDNGVDDRVEQMGAVVGGAGRPDGLPGLLITLAEHSEQATFGTPDSDGDGYNDEQDARPYDRDYR